MSEAVRTIEPARGPVQARVIVPGSKSITNRALICGALAEGESVLRNASESNDTALMTNGLNQLGVLVRKVEGALLVSGTGCKLFAPKLPIPVGNAGTTLRFLISLAGLAQGKTVFEGSGRMADRPMVDLQRALAQAGVQLDLESRQSRFMVQGGHLDGGYIRMRAARSSQFISSLLLVAPYAASDVVIRIEGEVSSAPYIDLTLDVIRAFGVEIEKRSDREFAVKVGQRYMPAEFPVEADASGATYFLAAAAICGGEVVVEGLRKNSRQADARFLGILQEMGCSVTKEGGGVRLHSNGHLRGVDVDMNAMPDAVPTLAVTALFASTPTRIRNVAHLRYKESDRLHALDVELRKLGASVIKHDDGLEIAPVPLHPAQLATHDDHRLAMSFAVAGLKVPGVRIQNPDCVKKSFPGFWIEFEKLMRDD